ncbi:MAG: hypothetical protein C4B57_11580 [Deltaproteobacteria bacterium]|nr:MAG: hypothetical protein C4B57_11580 [Deltaproteobacteria bacterium]
MKRCNYRLSWAVLFQSAESEGSSGVSLPIGVMSIIRPAITGLIATAHLRRSAVLWAIFSIPHPVFEALGEIKLENGRSRICIIY